MGHFGLYGLVKAMLLFVLSFFVLFAVDKTTTESLKKIGRALAISLCIIAVTLIALSLCTKLKGQYSCPLKYKYQNQCLR